jgi:hypothetical protein
MCNQCKEDEPKLLMDKQIDQQTAAKQYALPLRRGPGHDNITETSGENIWNL